MAALDTFQVSIKNVGLIRNGHIEFRPGFTVIRGPSGSGKSTLIRAIEDTIYNTPGDSTVTFGEVEQVVRVVYNGTTVIRRRDLKSKDCKVLYKVNDEVFSKTGRAALDEVVKPFRMDELELLTDRVRLNFVNQFSVPFLVQESPAKIFEVVTSDSSVNLLDVLKSMRADNEELSQTRRTNEALIDQLQTQINQDEETVKALSAVPAHLERLVSLEPYSVRLARIIDLVRTLSESRELGKSLVVRYKATQSIDTAGSSLPESFSSLFDRLMPLIAKASVAFSNLSSADERLRRIDRENELLGSLKDPAPLVSRVHRLLTLINQANTSADQINTASRRLTFNFPEPDNKLYSRLANLVLKALENVALVTNLSKKNESLTTSLKEVQSALAEFKVCPLCNKPLS